MRISDWSSDVCSSDLEPDPATPTLVRVHVHNRLADGLHWRRADFGPLVGEVLAAIDREGRGALVLLGEAHRSEAEQAEALLARIRQQPQAEPADRKSTRLNSSH